MNADIKAYDSVFIDVRHNIPVIDITNDISKVLFSPKLWNITPARIYESISEIEEVILFI